MKKRLLSITDENSILITVEFLESGFAMKNGKRRICCRELDLIVRNDITCDQLIAAVGEGILNKLRTQYGIDREQLDTGMVYSNIHHKSGRLRPQRPKVERLRTYADVAKKDYQEREVLPTYWDEQMLKLTPEERECNSWIGCWKVFQECFSAYCKGYPVSETFDPEQISTASRGRHPVIARGSVNINAEPGSLLSVAHNAQIWLEQKRHGDLCLRDLGFVTSTRLIFDPLMWHHSAALFDRQQIAAFPWERLPDYAASNRQVLDTEEKEVHISAPDTPPQRQKTSILASVLSPMAASGALVGVWAAAGQAEPVHMGLLSGAMVLSGLAVGLTSRGIHDNTYRKELSTWRGHYEAYLRKLLHDISEKHRQDGLLLNQTYPPVYEPDSGADLVSMALRVSGNLFDRRPDHADYLAVRIGRSTGKSHLVPSKLEIRSELPSDTFSAIRYRNLKNSEECPFALLLPHEKKRLREKTDGTDGYLNELADGIRREYAYLPDAPVLLRLNEIAALGVLYQDGAMDFLPFLSNFLLDLCFHHRPEDVQIVILCEETEDYLRRQEVIRRFKHLPHFRRLLGDLSPFAFGQEDAGKILDRLLEMQTQRKSAAANSQSAHIVVVALQEYGLREHPIAAYLPGSAEAAQGNPNGITFLMCTHQESQLPGYCSAVIKVTPRQKWYLLPYNRNCTRTGSGDDVFAENQYEFLPEPVVDPKDPAVSQQDKDRYHRAFKTLSALLCQHKEQSAVPCRIDLFALLEQNGTASGAPVNLTHLPGKLNRDWLRRLRQETTKLVLHNWHREPGQLPKRDAARTLAVPVGRSASGIVELDLHRNGDGPNLLVASGEKMGKTQTILTILTGLCAYFTPEEVNILLVDLNRSGLVNRLSHLPHLAGVITTDFEEGNTAPQRLHQSFRALDEELNRRRQLLNRMGVKTVDEYNHARRDLPNHIRNTLLLSPEKNPELLRELGQLPPIPHLLLAVDNYGDLLRLTATADSFFDLNNAVYKLARLSSEQGMHLILADNDPENNIPQMLRDHFQTFICLKTSSAGVSDSMIGSNLAAACQMPGGGRAYLRSRNTQRNAYFQIGYADAYMFHSRHSAFQVTYACPSGDYESFFDSDLDWESAIDDTVDPESVEQIDQLVNEEQVDRLDGEERFEKRKTSRSVKEKLERKPNPDHRELLKMYLQSTQLDMLTRVIEDCFQQRNLPKPRWIFRDDT